MSEPQPVPPPRLISFDRKDDSPGTSPVSKFDLISLRKVGLFDENSSFALQLSYRFHKKQA